MKEKFDLFIIDDDPTVIKKLKSMLAKYPISIRSFTEPILGLKEMTENPPRMVFVDYNMPLMDGKEMIIKISERYLFQHFQVYLITALDIDETKKMQLQTLGFSRIIHKPFKDEELAKALADIGIFEIPKTA
jgi:CheY-like chemotaxis protein